MPEIVELPSEPLRRRLPAWLKRPLPQPEMLFTSDLISELMDVYAPYQAAVGKLRYLEDREAINASVSSAALPAF